MQYLFVGPVAAYRISESAFAMESAFCDHLRVLKEMLSPTFTDFIVCCLRMSDGDYERSKSFLGVIDEPKERIRLVTLFDMGLSPRGFWFRESLRSMRVLKGLVRDADLVHSGLSYDVKRPFEFSALILGALLKKKTIAVTDMDLRDDPKMLFKVGRFSRKNYFASTAIYEPLRDLQHRWIAKNADLVLFKGQKLVDDYGAGRENVVGIRDPGFSIHHVIPEAELAEKISRLDEKDTPLRMLYFGRLEFYKGVDRCIDAFCRAHARSSGAMELHIMGHGKEEKRLRKMVDEKGVSDAVIFREPLPYGDSFFQAIRTYDLMLAAPLSVDTPRSSWDALASGLPILAFDTEFYRDLGHYTGAVSVVAWPSVVALSEKMSAFAENKSSLAPLMRNCGRVARENTQEVWLRKRVAWTQALFDR